MAFGGAIITWLLVFVWVFAHLPAKMLSESNDNLTQVIREKQQFSEKINDLNATVDGLRKASTNAPSTSRNVVQAPTTRVPLRTIAPTAPTPQVPSQIKRERISAFLLQSTITGTVRIIYFGNTQPEIVDVLLDQFGKGGWKPIPMHIGTGSAVKFVATEPLYLLTPDANGPKLRAVIGALEAADMDAPVHPGIATMGPMSGIGVQDVTIVINDPH